MKDKKGRNIDYMRISLTDRCNLRCQYCMPAEKVPVQYNKDILKTEEIIRIVKAGAKVGIRKIRLTGGEPLLRKDIVRLVHDIKKVEGIEEVAITTNGVLLEEMLDDLIQAGLTRINLSLDTLDEDVFRELTRFSDLSKVKKGIEKCKEENIQVKINAVLIKGINDKSMKELIELTYTWKVDVRFIELMPIGCGKNFEGFSTEEILQKIEECGISYKKIKDQKTDGVAEYIQLDGAKGKVGFISPISHQFCSSCNRIRVTSEGFLKPCLHAKIGIDLKDELRKSDREEEIVAILKESIRMKPESHKFTERSAIEEKRNMHQIGG